jgi:hypothetical protein
MRILDDPLKVWHPCIASTVAKEMSGVAAASRDDLCHLAAFAGPAPRAFLACRGAFERRDHSASYPVTVGMLWLRREDIPRNYVEAYRALLAQGLMTLRAGMPPNLKRSMFRSVGKGKVLLWTRRTKTRRGDKSVADPVMKPQLSAVAGPVWDWVWESGEGESDWMFRTNTKEMGELLHLIFPHVDSFFTLRVHGMRNGSDTVLQALRVPRDIIEAAGWWARDRRPSGYYASICINILFAATAMMHLVVIEPVAPGFCRLVSVGGPVPDWANFWPDDEELAAPVEAAESAVADEQWDSSDDDHRAAIVPGQRWLDKLLPARRSQQRQQQRGMQLLQPARPAQQAAAAAAAPHRAAAEPERQVVSQRRMVGQPPQSRPASAPRAQGGISLIGGLQAAGRLPRRNHECIQD